MRIKSHARQNFNSNGNPLLPRNLRIVIVVAAILGLLSVTSYIAVLVDALQNHTERCNGYLEAARKARSSCDWAQAEKLYLLAKEESQKSSDPMLLPQSLSDLAAMYYAKHQWTQAESNFQESLAAWQRAFDRQHNPTPEAVEARLATLVGFAHLLEEEKQFGRAEDLYKQAIKQDEGALSEAMMTRLRRDYIKLLKEQGKSKQSYGLEVELDSINYGVHDWQEEFKMIAHQVQDQGVLDEEKTDALAIAATNLHDPVRQSEILYIRALAYMVKGKDLEAQAALRSAVGIVDHAVSKSVNNTRDGQLYQIKDRIWLATSLEASGKGKEAETLIREAYALNSSYSRDVLCDVCNFCARWGKTDEANRMFRRTIPLVEKAQNNSQSLGNFELQYAYVLFGQKRYHEAEPFAVKALQLCDNNGTPGFATHALLLMDIYSNQRQFKAYLDTARRALPLWEKLHGADSAWAAMGHLRLADAYFHLKRMDNFDLEEKKALALLKQPPRPNDSGGAEVEHGLYLGNLLCGNYCTNDWKQSDQAISNYKQALTIAQSCNDPVGIIDCSTRIADAFDRLGQHEQAKPLLRVALAAMEKQKGPSDSAAILIRQRLAGQQAR